MKLARMVPLLCALSGLATLSALAVAQGPAGAGSSAVTPASQPPSVTPAKPVLTYTRPTEKTKLRNYIFDAFGPYPIAGATFVAGINQAYSTPPEWKQGGEAFGQRVGSNFGIAAITTTTRYGLAEAFREDTLYYRCECKGVFRRLGHAVISTVSARRGEDGHRVFSIPAVVSPYVGTMTAVYGWYPDRYNAKDAFRMGNYNLLATLGGNIAIEFIYGGPHSWLSKVHLNKSRGTSARTPSP